MTRWQMIARQIRHRKEAIAPFGHDATRAALDPQRLTWSILHRKVANRRLQPTARGAIRGHTTAKPHSLDLTGFVWRRLAPHLP